MEREFDLLTTNTLSKKTHGNPIVIDTHHRNYQDIDTHFGA